MTTFAIGQVQVITAPDPVIHIAEEIITNLSPLFARELQGNERAEVMAVICDGLYRAQNDVIRRANKNGDYSGNL